MNHRSLVETSPRSTPTAASRGTQHQQWQKLKKHLKEEMEGIDAAVVEMIGEGFANNLI